METRRDENQKARRSCCKIALNLVSCDDNLCLFPMLVDDEELELRELQAGSNPLTCGGHFAAAGNYGCSLCKGLFLFFCLNFENWLLASYVYTLGLSKMIFTLICLNFKPPARSILILC